MEIIQDVILTDSFLMLGTIANKYRRLSQLLDHYQKLFVPLVDVTMYDHADGEQIHVSDVLVNLDEVIFAHEFVDSGGDIFQKNMCVDGEKTEIRSFYNGRINLELRGYVRQQAYEINKFNNGFFVMEQPQIKGLPGEVPAVTRLVQELPYIIVQKKRISYVFDSQSVLQQS